MAQLRRATHSEINQNFIKALLDAIDVTLVGLPTPPADIAVSVITVMELRYGLLIILNALKSATQPAHDHCQPARIRSRS